MSVRSIFLISIAICILVNFVATQQSGRHEIVLHENPKYTLAWEFTQNQESVLFDAVVESTGYVGLGLSHTGTMEQADFLIGGVNTDGSYYYGDYHGVENGFPILDESQDWFVAVATENTTHTTLLHDRKLNTGDSFDIPIQDEDIYLLWSIGATDTLEHHTERGAVYINLLTGSIPPTTVSTSGTWPTEVTVSTSGTWPTEVTESTIDTTTDPTLSTTSSAPNIFPKWQKIRFASFLNFVYA